MVNRIELPLPPTVVPPLTKVERKAPVALPLPMSVEQMRQEIAARVAPPSFHTPELDQVRQSIADGRYSLDPPPLTVIKAPEVDSPDRWVGELPREGDDEDYDAEGFHDDDYEDDNLVLEDQPAWRPEPVKTPSETFLNSPWPFPSRTLENVSEAPQNASNLPSIQSLFAPDESETVNAFKDGWQSPTNSSVQYVLFFKDALENKTYLLEIIPSSKISGATNQEWLAENVKRRYANISEGPIADARSKGVGHITPCQKLFPDSPSIVSFVVRNYDSTLSRLVTMGYYWVQEMKSDPIQIA